MSDDEQKAHLVAASLNGEWKADERLKRTVRQWVRNQDRVTVALTLRGGWEIGGHDLALGLTTVHHPIIQGFAAAPWVPNRSTTRKEEVEFLDDLETVDVMMLAANSMFEDLVSWVTSRYGTEGVRWPS